MNCRCLWLILLLPLGSDLAAEDTLVVSVFTWQDPSPRGWNAPYEGIVQFPESSENWRKIILVKTLKCDSATAGDVFPCGEWDYITETAVFDDHGDQEEKIQLISFVTPYGKRLELGGERGWTWEFDVTDYAPVLTGTRRIVAGNNQELQDLKFLFIHGTPPRQVLSVENLYPPGLYKYEHLADDSVLKQRELVLREDARGFKLKARISGHGHAGPHNCCEWDNKTHTYHLGSWEQVHWQTWKDCGFNPIYPQGGTWPFDRAGWCPGTATDEFDFELTPLVFPGDTLLFDYSIEPYRDNGEKDGEYRVSHQLFSYGPPSFEINAAVVDIIAPSRADAHSRINPICGRPIIKIRNQGRQDLRSARIRYGVQGGRLSRFDWIGSLSFMEEEQVELPPPRWRGFKKDAVFIVTIESPNGQLDPCPADDRMTSRIPAPIVLPKSFILVIETNDQDRAKENACVISDVDGGIHFEKLTFADSTEYRELIILEPGCYQFRFLDRYEDGIMPHWWYRGSQPDMVGISGRVRIMDEAGEETLVNFPADFGQELFLNFRVD